MALSQAGMKANIIAELPGSPNLSAGQGDKAIQAQAYAVVDEIANNATADITTTSSGTCTNKITGGGPVPGAYSGTGTLNDGGTISGLSSVRLKSAIKSNVESLVSGFSWAAGNSDATVEAIAEAIVEEVEGYGKVTVTTSESGSVAAGGGPVSGNGTGTGSITSLNATRLRDSFKTKIAAKTGAAVDWDAGAADASLMALATGVVDHIHGNAEVACVTDLSGVTCPPPGGAGSGTAQDSAADIS